MYRLKIYAIALAVLFFSSLSVGTAGGNRLCIQVKDAQLRTAPSFMGKIVATLPYGSEVTVTTESGGWANVELADGTTGWLHGSALTRENIRLTSGAESVDRYASSDEVALAGKGFNAEIEARYRAENDSLDYSWIDRMENDTITPEEIDRFVREGDLSPKGGTL